jgi:energy-coupling factor transporter transmembrane protein EcfT
MLMSQLRPWQLIMLAVFTTVVCIAFVQGIRYQSFWGITGALASGVALMICVQIMQKMNELEQEEDY